MDLTTNDTKSTNKRPPCVEILDPLVVEILRRKTPVERLAMGFSANRTMRLLLEGHFRTYHPAWDQQRIQQEIARRMLYEAD
jgi:hypothetical protein